MQSLSINRPADDRPRVPPDTPRAPRSAGRILLVQTSYLGDTILSTPVIAALHRRHPRAELWMMTTPEGAELVRCDPLVHAVIAFDKRSRDRGLRGLVRMGRHLRQLAFERAYALQRSYRTALMLALSGIRQRTGFHQARLSFLYHTRAWRDPNRHDVHRNLSLLAEEAPSRSDQTALRLFPPPIESISPDLIRLVGAPRPYVLLVPGSAWETKRWHWEHFRTVAHDLIAQGYRVILIGARSDREINRQVAQDQPVVDLTGRTSVSEAMVMVRHAAGMVCNDSMALHMASAFRIPCVVVFCATSPAFGFGPWQNPGAVVLEAEDLPCKPCARHGGRRCPTGTRACMKDLPPDKVLAALQRVLPAP